MPTVPTVHPMSHSLYQGKKKKKGIIRGTTHQAFLSDTQFFHIVSQVIIYVQCFTLYKNNFTQLKKREEYKVRERGDGKAGREIQGTLS